jgi:ATP-binding cassette subfamily F protein 3
VYKKAGVLSGGERTRLAVARMLLRPSNTLLLDEPTNHLDIDSKEVLLDALVDYGGTLVFVSHDRYFVEKLATKIIDVGEGKATLYPGTYEAFLWSKTTNAAAPAIKAEKQVEKKTTPETKGVPKQEQSYEDRKRESAEKKKRERGLRALRDRVIEIEMRIADREKAIKDVEQKMSAPDFYNDHEKSKPILVQHQELMWEVGELLGQWEMLQSELNAYEN